MRNIIVITCHVWPTRRARTCLPAGPHVPEIRESLGANTFRRLGMCCI